MSVALYEFDSTAGKPAAAAVQSLITVDSGRICLKVLLISANGPFQIDTNADSGMIVGAMMRYLLTISPYGQETVQ